MPKKRPKPATAQERAQSQREVAALLHGMAKPKPVDTDGKETDTDQPGERAGV